MIFDLLLLLFQLGLRLFLYMVIQSTSLYSDTGFSIIILEPNKDNHHSKYFFTPCELYTSDLFSDSCVISSTKAINCITLECELRRSD